MSKPDIDVALFLYPDEEPEVIVHNFESDSGLQSNIDIMGVEFYFNETDRRLPDMLQKALELLEKNRGQSFREVIS